MTNIEHLESEAIYVLREAAAQFDRPVLLFSGGKDSICLIHIAAKAFYPGKIPFPVMHIDTGHNFPETIEFRDRFLKDLGAKLIVQAVQDTIDSGKVQEETGPNASRNSLQSVTLVDGINKHGFDAAIAGARRDEEKSRAKERFFSFRNQFGTWDPKNQRPEVWNIFNGEKHVGEGFRIFPLSNWTEVDVWQYIESEGIEMPGLYFSHRREVVIRKGIMLANSPHLTPMPGDKIRTRAVRFRTIGDMTCTGAIESEATTVSDIVQELQSTRTAERGSRIDDKRSTSSLEDRKKQGYF